MFPSLYKYKFRFSVAYNDFKKIIITISNFALFFFSLIGFLVVVYDIGFMHNEYFYEHIDNVYSTVIYILFASLLVNLLFTFRSSRKAVSLLLDLLILGYMSFFILAKIRPDLFDIHSFWFRLLSERAFIYISIIILFIIEFSLELLKLLKRNSNPAFLFVFSFAFLIIIGAFMLLLPNSTTEGGISLIDAFFTSTSAVCVTGLIVVDTATKFTVIGQSIIMMLMQIGGLGVMTFASFLGMMYQSNSSFSNQIIMQDFIVEERIGEIFNTIYKIILITFLIEFIGFVFIYASIAHLDWTIKHKIFFSAFHTVAAFANAGFSTLSNGLYENIVRFNYNLHLVIAFLIILGSIGFPILFNYYKYIKHFIKNKIRQVLTGERYRHLPLVVNVNTRIVIITTFILIVFGTLFMYTTEYDTVARGLSLKGKIVTAFFSAVSARTAGFATIDVTRLSSSTALLFIFLMWIGASPNSTGGGIKTTTFAIAIMSAINVAKGKDRVELFNREIDDNSIKRAHAIIVLSVIIIGMGIYFVNMFDPEKDLLKVGFECVSAFATCGISLGITADLSMESKIIITLLMYIGRMGTITLLMSMLSKIKILSYKYPKENIYIN